MRRLLNLVALALLVGLWLLPEISIARAAGEPGNAYDAQITLADGRLQRGSNMEAFSEAVKAIGIDPARFEGYYFAGLALFRQQEADRALPYAREALTRAPEAQRKTVQELADKLERAAKVRALIAQGAQAETDGKLYSAASSYTAAFDLEPTQVKAGQAGVRVWLVLKQPSTAARLLRFLAASDDAAVRDAANKQLSAMATELAQISRDGLARGWSLLAQAAAAADDRLEAAAQAFNQAIDANPKMGGVDSPYIGLAATRAAQRQKTEFYSVFRSAAKNGFVPDAVDYFDRSATRCTIGCNRDQLLAPFLCDPEVQAAFVEIYGPTFPGLAREFCTGRERRQVLAREEAARKKAEEEKQKKAQEEAHKKAEDERKAREERERQRKAAIEAREKALPKFYEYAATLLIPRANACFMSQGKARDIVDICLCLHGYNEERRTLAYEFQIKGIGETKDTVPRKITYDASASFTTPVKADERLAYLMLDANRPWEAASIGPNNKVTVTGRDERVTTWASGQEAFWQSYVAAADGLESVDGDPLGWSMGLADGAITITIGRKEPASLIAKPTGTSCSWR